MNVAIGVLSAVFWGVILLSVLVFVHEGGHYLMARAFHVRVTEFYLGLPCRIKLFRKSKKYGTEVGVTPLLLGGYNRICGMESLDGLTDEMLAEAFAIVQQEGRVDAEVVADRMGIELAQAYDLLAMLTDWAAIRPYYNPDLDEKPNQKEFPAAFETLARDANMLTEYDLGHDFSMEGSTEAGEPRPVSRPNEQLEAEKSHTYLGCSLPKRLAILVAGPLVNIILAFVLTVGVFMAVEQRVPINENVLGSVEQGSIAESAGLREGDELVSVGETSIADWNELATALQAACAAGDDFDISYVRDGKEAVAHIDLPEDEQVEIIGVSPRIESFHLTLSEAVTATFNYVGMVVSVVARLIMPQHTMEVLNQSSSIVGISVMASEAVSKGFLDVISLMAAISMSLGFMNLLPIPPLDGGKVLTELIEAIIHRPLSMKARMAMSYVGIAFFVFVFVVVVRNDVLRLLAG